MTNLTPIFIISNYRQIAPQMQYFQTTENKEHRFRNLFPTSSNNHEVTLKKTVTPRTDARILPEFEGFKKCSKIKHKNSQKGLRLHQALRRLSRRGYFRSESVDFLRGYPNGFPRPKGSEDGRQRTEDRNMRIFFFVKKDRILIF